MASRAQRDKENKCAELLQGDRWRLVVVGTETGSRWSTEALQFVEMLACSETSSFLGVDTTMVAHALGFLWQSFRQLARFAFGRSARHRWTTARFVPGLRKASVQRAT